MSHRWMLFCLLLLVSTQLPAAKGHYLGELSWQVAEKELASTPVVILPFAAGAKEHGPHLPMNADQKTMDYLLDVAVEKTDVLVAPPVLHGWFPAFREFPGTEVADPTVFQNYLLEVAKSLVKQGAQRILFLNTGIQNATGLPISIVAREIRVQFDIPTLVVSWDHLETEDATQLQSQQRGGHADEIETAIQLYLQPDAVDLELAEQDYRENAIKADIGYQPGAFSRDEKSALYSESGVFGDARLAKKETGEKVLSIMGDNLIKAVETFQLVNVQVTKQ